MSQNILVLDANILIRAVLGKKVRELMFQFNTEASFFTPDVCMNDARKYLPDILKKRSKLFEPALEVLEEFTHLIQVVDKNIYQEYEIDAKKRIYNRDIFDWPVVATALMLNSPIWTEDQDFFGTGIPVWTTDRIHIFFESL
ncbi:MAG: PIN domain-containing protein [Taibaiella sp.]|jgi:predicted nucleic acid-binding protein